MCGEYVFMYCVVCMVVVGNAFVCMWCVLYVCSCGGVCVVCGTCACACICVRTALLHLWREEMNALSGEEGDTLPRAAQSLWAPAHSQKRQECFASGKLILPSRTKNPIKERMREM